jgi:anti-sigma factor RsiW
VRKKLVGLPAGECTPSEEQALRRHLGDCPGCAAELESLRSVDLLLDLLEPEEPPADLAESIMESVTGDTATKGLPPCRAGHGRPAGFTAGLIRDITVAAAAALAVFWIGGSLLGPVASSAEGRVSGAVTSYVHFTGVAVSRTGQAVEDLNSMFATAGKLNPTKYETGK